MKTKTPAIPCGPCLLLPSDDRCHSSLVLTHLNLPRRDKRLDRAMCSHVITGRLHWVIMEIKTGWRAFSPLRPLWWDVYSRIGLLTTPGMGILSHMRLLWRATRSRTQSSDLCPMISHLWPETPPRGWCLGPRVLMFGAEVDLTGCTWTPSWLPSDSLCFIFFCCAGKRNIPYLLILAGDTIFTWSALNFLLLSVNALVEVVNRDTNVAKQHCDKCWQSLCACFCVWSTDCRAAACFPEQVDDQEDKGYDSARPGSAALFDRWFTFIHSSTHFLNLDATINTVSRRKSPSGHHNSRLNDVLASFIAHVHSRKWL